MKYRYGSNYFSVFHYDWSKHQTAPELLATASDSRAQLPTLAMLEQVLIGCADIRLLVVATFRTTPPDRSDELITRLAELHRFDGVRRLDLGGLDTEAIAEFGKVVELSKSESESRLDLAELMEQQGERSDALALADAVQPLDNSTMKRREELALRLAVLSGDLERARQAAERLFGLRLDTETQVKLAGQMNQLGQHELAEAVLGRTEAALNKGDWEQAIAEMHGLPGPFAAAASPWGWS